MQIIAHRGAAAYEPENTLRAFQKAMEMGADFLETDVRRTKDGFLVLCHDYESNGKTIKLSALVELNLPTLEQLLGILKPEVKLNIEIKNDDNIYPNIEREILEVLNSRGARLKENILISSFDYPTLKRVRALDEKIKIGLLTRDFDISQAVALNAYSVNLSKKRVNAQIVKTCHKNKMKVFVYTVNTAEEAAETAALKIDAIFSDYPDLLDK